MFIQNKNRNSVKADTEIADEATDLLFEAEDVAQLISEITGEDVNVQPSEDGESVDFTVGDEVYTVQAEGDEELVESSSRIASKKRNVSASRNTQKNARTLRKIQK